METRTAALLDRHPLWLDALEQVATGIGITVVSKTTAPEAMLADVDEFSPDVLIAEIATGPSERDSLPSIRRARELVENLRVIALSDDNDAEHVSAAFAAGASVYVVKTAHAEDLVSAFRQVFEHSLFIVDPRQRAVVGNQATSSIGSHNSHGLTSREREVLELVAEGRTNAQLAASLFVAEQTVKFHLSNIFRKLGVANRTEAVRWAHVHHVVSIATPNPLE